MQPHFFASPEEARAFMERQQMEAQDIVHRIEDLFDSLDKDQVMTLRYIMQGTMRSESYAPHIDGQLAGVLKYKFSVCGGCGVNHAEELLGGEMDKESGPSEQETIEAMQSSLTEDVMEKMQEYGLHFPTEEESVSYRLTESRDLPEAAVICDNCKMVYQSLADRMRRPTGVEGCEGCMHKGAWG